MKHKKAKLITESILTTVFMGLLIYAAYSLWYIFYGTDSGTDVHLYTILSGSALGWLLVLLTDVFSEKLKKALKIILKAAAFLLGNGAFQLLLWGINAQLNETNTENDTVIINTFSIFFAVCAVIIPVIFISRAKKGYKAVNIIFAVVFTVVSFGGIYMFNRENIAALEYKKDIRFDSISAEEMVVSPEEKSLCTQWYNDKLFSENGEYPFAFSIDGEKCDFSDWEKSLGEKPDFGSVYRGGQTEYLVLTSKEKALEVTVEATVFEENATCQWVVYIKNTGSGNSGVISDFCAADMPLSTGKAEIYYSLGSDTAASDFSLIRKALSSSVRSFSATEGKPTQSNLPYFNIDGELSDVVVGVGWTGQWKAAFSENKGETFINVKQEYFDAYLLPGEQVRSPLVSLTFYNNDNPLKGFNLFRSWITDCVYPENVTKNQYTVMEVAGPASERTSDEIIDILDSLDDKLYEQIDAFWMDAGWYSYNEGWHDGVGNWTVDESRYDKGIIELSSYAKEKGLGHVLWYEPERLYRDTVFFNEASKHEGWIIDIGEDNIMWNLASEDAFSYYCDYLLASMQENGITVYRQDFNFAPLAYWQKADNDLYDSRTGICENHYVTNLYRFLDYLYENIDGLIIDNCASGGKRLDLEMTYRSIPFWRSDYNCSYHADLFDATQSHTYGISFWLPISGTALYMADEYASRSAIMPLMLMDFFSHQHPEFSYNKEPRELMTGNYYPLCFGSYDNNKILAMEYCSRDARQGTALIYKREKVRDDSFTVVLNGLIKNAQYSVYDIDAPETIYTLSGEELMTKGLSVALPEGRKAVVLLFSAE